MKFTKYLVVVAFPITGFLTGCATTSSYVEESPVANELQPMEKPALPLHSRIQQYDNLLSKNKNYDLIEISAEGIHRYVNSDGCEWTNNGDIVSQSLSWSKCSSSDEWHSGESVNFTKSGEIWPLNVGNKASYTFTLVNAHGIKKGKRTLNCKVAAQVNITTTGGNYDTFKVVCKRGDNNWSQSRIYYFSPEHNHIVKFVRWNTSDGIERNTDHLKIEQL